MKKLLTLPIAVLLVAAMAVITPVKAQNWIPRNGYWEVISTVAKPDESTVRFYDLQGRVVDVKQVTGMVLDLRKKKTCRWLNRQLQVALVAWAARR
jgi:hypothetical protein